jgi:hypothetical protein
MEGTLQVKMKNKARWTDEKKRERKALKDKNRERGRAVKRTERLLQLAREE